MGATIFTITTFVSMVALIIAILVGHYSGREQNRGILECLIITATAIPVGMWILSIPLYNLAIDDWPSGGFFLVPQAFLWIASFFGGLIGIKSGEIWNQGEPSCIRCLLSLVTVLTLLSLVIVLIP
ncbi:MAG: hypothetical protein ACFFEV_02545 [Candidatus Thorarchaeota archaeon]